MAVCETSVGIVRALIFGANGACIDLGFGSIISALAVFVVLVLILQFVVRRVLGRVFGNRSARRGAVDAPAAPTRRRVGRYSDYDGGPIRSSRDL